MNKELLTTYMVELLYEKEPIITAHELLNEFRKRGLNVEKLGKQEDLLLFAFPDHSFHSDKGDVPVQIFLAKPDQGKSQSNVDEALQQSWGWPEARQVVAGCQTSLLVTDLLAKGLEYKTRLNLFHNVLESVLTVAPCQAIHWVPSQQIVNPIAYIEACRADNFHPLQYAINVRFYSVSNGEEGEKLMDTMGLGTLGLPDLQCHFRRLEPREVAGVLYDTAYYLFDNGDVIKTGNTLKGIRDTDKWRCQREYSMINPEREVIDIDPGQTFSAGNRE